MTSKPRRRRKQILTEQGLEKICNAIWEKLKKCPNEYNFSELSELTGSDHEKPLDSETVAKILRCEGNDLKPIRHLFNAFGLELDKSDYTNYTETPQAQISEPALIQSTSVLGKVCGLPSLPQKRLPRPDELKRLKTLLEHGNIGIRGMGGMGKTVLAGMLAQDEEVQRAFPDGVFWLTIGKQPAVTLRQSDLAKMLGDSPPLFQDEQQGRVHLSQLLAEKACLLILDDAWDFKHVEPFLALGSGCRMVVTTRYSKLVQALEAQESPIYLLDENQAINLLALRAGEHPENLSDEVLQIARKVAQECRYLPLALAMVGSMVQGKPERWEYVLYRLSQGDLEKIKADFPGYDYPNLFRAIQVSLEDLAFHIQTRYLDFAIFLENTTIPESTLEIFWEAEGLDKYETQEVLDELVARSLVQQDDQGFFSLHDLQYDYVRKQASDLLVLHNRFLNAYAKQCCNGWHTGSNDGYFFEYLAYHMTKAGQKDELRKLLLDFNWLQAKLDATDVYSLIADFDFFPEDYTLSLVQGAIKLAVHILLQDKNQLATQLTGRLLSFENQQIQDFLENIKDCKSHPWLRPFIPSMAAPGGALIRTIKIDVSEAYLLAVFPNSQQIVFSSSNNTFKIVDLEIWAEPITVNSPVPMDTISSLAITPDGQFGIAGLKDGKIILWELYTGVEKCSLCGHNDSVNDMVVTSDGHYIISASEDTTIKIWDIKKQKGICTLQGHTQSVSAVAITPDKKFIISGGWDKSLKIWSWETGNLVNSFDEHIGIIKAVTVTPDGQYAIFASKDFFGDQTLKVEDCPWDATLKVWDLKNNKELHTLESHTNYLFEAVKLTTDGQYVVFTSRGSLFDREFECTVKVWDWKAAKKLQSLQIYNTFGVEFSTLTNGGEYAISLEENKISIWNLKPKNRTFTPPHDSFVDGVAINNNYVVSISNDLLKMWDLENGTELLCREIPNGIIPNGTIRLPGYASWSPESDDLLFTSILTENWEKIISISEEINLIVWNLKKGKELLILRGHTDRINAVAATPDGKRAISISEDNTARVWDLESGDTIAVFMNDVFSGSCAISPDGKTIVIGDWSGWVHFLSLEGV